jgi:ribonuclease D
MRMKVDSFEINYIDQQAGLRQAVHTLEQARAIAVDSESNSLYVYYEKVCLLQLSSENAHFILDPLALGQKMDLLAPVFSSPDIQKVFHAAEYDIMCLKRDFGFEFANLFDTMIAARILGKKEIGLSQLLESELGIHVDKKFQKADWGMRPLPKDMLEYAIHDTCYLIQLRDCLQAQLIEKGFMELATEDFNRMTKIPAGANHGDCANWWQIAGNQKKLTEKQTEILYHLCQWREENAIKRDLPPFKILSNNKMLEISMLETTTKEELAQLFPARSVFIKRYAESLMNAIHKDDNGKPIPQPQKHRCPSQAYLTRWDQLKSWRREYGAKVGVGSDVILPKDIMESIVAANPRSLQELELLMAEVPWRFNRFGEQILKTLHIKNHGETDKKLVRRSEA